MKENKDKTMKIVLVAPGLEFGGLEREIVQIVNKLDKERFEVSVWLWNKKGKLLDDVLGDVEVVDFKRKNKWSFVRIIWQMSRKLKRDKVDLLVQFTSNHSGVAGLWSNWLAGGGIKVIISMRNILSWRLESMNLFYKKLIEWFYPMADLIMPNSEAIVKDLVKNCGLPEDNMDVVESSVDVEKLDQSGNKPCGEIGQLLVVARLVEQKRIDLLLRSFEIVQKRMDCRLTIVGDGPLRGELEDLAVELRIMDKVEFLGFKEDPYKYMRQADVFVLTSETEGCPHVLLEAMACKLPIVCAEYPGVSEVVENDETGLVVGREPEDIARGIIKVLKDEKLANKMASKAFEQVKEHDISQVIKKYEQMFRKVISA